MNDEKLEYPEIQVVTYRAEEKNDFGLKQPSFIQHENNQRNPTGDTPQIIISPAKRRFLKAAMKVLADIVAKRDQRTREQDECAGA